MSLNSLAKIGPAGGGYDEIKAALAELQGLNFEVLAGAGADTKIDVAAIRPEDTIIGAINNNAGTITDIKSTLTIENLKASGTLTLASVIATDQAVVNGKTYTFQAGDPVTYGEVKVGANDTESAANLRDAINLYETNIAENPAEVVATSAAGVVTITAKDGGAAGNAIDISSPDATITASGATLANGSDTGGIKSSGITNQIIMLWFNKQ